MGDWYILNEAGEPVPEPDLIKAAEWVQKTDRSIAKTQIGNVTISTFFLGLDHDMYGSSDPRPLLWETMVFGGPLDQEQERYRSREDAVAGHAEMVRRVRQEIGESA